MLVSILVEISTDPQLIDDWVLISGVDSSLINEG